MTDVPESEKKVLDGLLHDTLQVERTIQDWGSPKWLSLGLGYQRGSSIPRTAIVLQHAATLVQTARYHIYMAYYERLRHHKYLIPPNIGGGNIHAYFNVTSFSLHAIASERHIRLALVLQHRINKALNIKRATRVTTEEAYKYLASVNLPYAEVLKPFTSDADWKWLREYRNRYEHQDPMLVEELGLQYRLRSHLWEVDEDPETKATTFSLSFNAGDPWATNVEEMLTKGVICFNLLGKQFDRYAQLVAAEIEESWQKGRHRIPES